MATKTDIQSLLKKSGDIADIFKQLSHSIRLQILCCLSEGEKSVGDLTDFCGLSQANTSQFLARMKKSGMLVSKRKGQAVYYHIQDPRLVELLLSVKKIFC